MPHNQSIISTTAHLPASRELPSTFHRLPAYFLYSSLVLTSGHLPTSTSYNSQLFTLPLVAFALTANRNHGFYRPNERQVLRQGLRCSPKRGPKRGMGLIYRERQLNGPDCRSHWNRGIGGVVRTIFRCSVRPLSVQPNCPHPTDISAASASNTLTFEYETPG